MSKYEIGLRVREKPLVIFRHAIAAITTGISDIHGESYEEIEENIVDKDFIGYDMTVHLINGRVIEGRLIKVSKYEIGLLSQGKAYIIPKNNIMYIEVK